MQRLTRTKLFLAALMLAAPLLAATTAAAEQAYITDKVSIDVHSLQNEEGLVVTSLMSGTPVEILITDGEYTQIKTPDNKTGWLNSKFLSSEKPAAEEYVQLLAKYKAATEELERAQVNLTKLPEVERVARNAGAAQDELKKRKSQIQTLERNLKARDKQLADAQQAVAELKQKLVTKQTASQPAPPSSDTQAELDAGAESEPATPMLDVNQGPFKVPFLWAVIAMLFTAIVGFLLGMKWLDTKLRKRHGGVRLY